MIDISGMRYQNAQKKLFETQAQIADRIGITSVHYSNILNGKANPTLAVLDKMCDAFECDIADLIKYVK